ncbi:TPA: hypothetical protein HA265_03750 [Candidatus Woesearchaeota archaeon]|nr:hypothetical protein [Candidatus Woesearchaeota archaeon]
MIIFLVAGCDELPMVGEATKFAAVNPQGADNQGSQQQAPVNGVTGQDMHAGNGTSSGKQADLPVDDKGDGMPEERPEPQREYCGDKICNGKENCVTCKDCACKDGAICYNKQCKKPACMKDEDCADGDPCTVDKCYFAGNPNAYCSDEVITKRDNDDGCCPKGARAELDMDCESVCGDGWCEFPEDESSCLKDCEFYGEHGSPASSGGASPQTPYYT